VNGILTADAVIFGFITFELRRISNRLKMATFVFALPLIGLLMTTVSSYFVDGVVRGYATIYTLIWATITFFYIILHYVYLTAFIKRFNVEID
jgi:hypothetical protein